MFRFTIRELILLTVIVAMGAAWWVDRAKLASQYDNALDVIADIDWAARQDRSRPLRDWTPPTRP